MTPFILQPDGVTLSQEEEDPSLQVDGAVTPAGPEAHVAIVRCETDVHGRDPLPEGHLAPGKDHGSNGKTAFLPGQRLD